MDMMMNVFNVILLREQNIMYMKKNYVILLK
jgi:hypothetical protein